MGSSPIHTAKNDTDNNDNKMKNTLFVFGCSYSSDFEKSGIEKEYELYKNGWPTSWAEILSEKLNMDLINKSKGSLSNNDIFERFCIESDKIKKDDIVIIGWSYLNRFRVADVNSIERWENITINSPCHSISKKTSEEIFINRTSPLYEIEIHNWENLIKSYAKCKGFSIYFWNAGIPFQEQDGYLLECFRKRKGDTFIDVIMSKGGLRIIEETKGEILDFHLSENGHVIQSELFYDEIKKYKQR